MTTSTTDAEAIARFSLYRRKQIAELRPWRPGDDMSDISVSSEDAKAGSPKLGDMIARNPKNHADQWLVAADYFADNFEPLAASRREAQEPVAWRYRWKIYGEWVSWRVSERSQASEHLLPSLEEYPLYLAPPPPAGGVEMPTPNNRFSPRMLLLDDLHAVCVGGRWDGWKFWKHPDGQWVSLEKLAEEPRAALNGGRRDE